MERNSRTHNSMKNIGANIAYQLLNLILAFVNRTVFIRVLGVGYLGISGLFSDILTMLTLADLGFTSAMTFSMYKPLADKDYTTLAGLTNFYKKVYRVIAAAVICMGLAVIPFLPYMVNLQQNVEHLVVYYILYLANTVASYLVTYKTSILTADQKSYVLVKYNTYWSTIQTIVLTLILLVTRNYILYLILQVGFVYASNFYKSHIAQKMYPFIGENVKLPKEITRGIFKNIGSVFLYKISGVLINATDNMLISILTGTENVGYYSNYNIVVAKMSGIVNTIFYSLTASLGNLIVKEGFERRYQVFQVMQSVSLILSTFCATCVLLLEEDLIRIWLGDDFTLGILVLSAIVLNFYFSIVLLPIWVFREAAGLYRKTKFVMLGTAVINIAASIILGKIMGLAGILFATSIARFVTYFWYEPLLLFKHFFGKSCLIYYIQMVKGIGVTALSMAAAYISSGWLVPQTAMELIVKGIIAAATSLIIAMLFYRRSEGFKLMWRKGKEILHYTSKKNE